MVKIDDLMKERKETTSVKEKVLQYLKGHKDEVLQYDSKEFEIIFPNDKIETIDWSLYTLEKEGKIGKAKLGRNVFFGSHEAIEELTRRYENRTNSKLEEEVVIVAGDPQSIFENPEDFFEKGRFDAEFTEHVTKEWGSKIPIRKEPEYVAIYATGKNAIVAILEVNHDKSKLEQGRIVPQSKPLHVYIPIRFGKLTLQGIKYTTFQKLTTHATSDEL